MNFKWAKLIGGILVVLGIIGFGSIQLTDHKNSWTSLIPAFFGLPIYFAGIWGSKSKCGCGSRWTVFILSLTGFGASAWRVWVKQTGMTNVFNKADWSGFALYKWSMVFAMAMLMGALMLISLKHLIKSKKA